jgi:hypothetical protein
LYFHGALTASELPFTATSWYWQQVQGH